MNNETKFLVGKYSAFVMEKVVMHEGFTHIVTCEISLAYLFEFNLVIFILSGKIQV